LSERELEVLRLLEQGASNQEIAQGLVLALSTVKSHVRTILAKLEASNRTQAVKRARTLGLPDGLSQLWSQEVVEFIKQW